MMSYEEAVEDLLCTYEQAEISDEMIEEMMKL